MHIEYRVKRKRLPFATCIALNFKLLDDVGSKFKGLHSTLALDIHFVWHQTTSSGSTCRTLKRCGFLPGFHPVMSSRGSNGVAISKSSLHLEKSLLEPFGCLGDGRKEWNEGTEGTKGTEKGGRNGRRERKEGTEGRKEQKEGKNGRKEWKEGRNGRNRSIGGRNRKI